MRARALAAFPGGFGTMDEMFESLTLIQTGKARDFPVVLLDRAYWAGLIGWLGEHVLGGGIIAPEEAGLLTVTDDPAEAVRIVVDAYAERHHPDRLPG